VKQHSFYDAMNERYAAPAWALFYEVADGTGRNHSHWADAVAMSLYPSRGLDLYGHEFKSDRGDWLREVKNPDKAESIAKFCDYWFAVDTNDGKAIKVEEVPPNWGLLVWNGKTLRMVKKAEKLKPKSIDRIFMAGLLRSANKAVNAAERKLKDDDWVRHLDQKSYNRGYETAKESLEIKYKHFESKVAKLEKVIQNFEQASGIHLNEWNWGNMAAAIHMIEKIRGLNGFTALVEEAGTLLGQRADEIKMLAATIKEFEVKHAVRDTIAT